MLVVPEPAANFETEIINLDIGSDWAGPINNLDKSLQVMSEAI